jgi:hypothetical protein
MGYTESKQKILFPCHTAAEISQIAILVPGSRSWDGARRGPYPVSRKTFIVDSFFPQAITPENLIGARWAVEAPGTAKLRTDPTRRQPLTPNTVAF